MFDHLLIFSVSLVGVALAIWIWMKSRKVVSPVAKVTELVELEDTATIEHMEPMVPRNTRRGAFGLPVRKPEFDFDVPTGGRSYMSHEERRRFRRNRKNQRRAKASR